MPAAQLSLSNELNLPIITELTSLMGRMTFQDHYPELSHKWLQLMARAKIYSRLAGYKRFNKTWLANKNTRKHLAQLQLGIEAIDELVNEGTLDDQAREKIEWELRLALEAELAFLEIRQLRKLIKDQDLYRPEIVVLQNSLRFKIEQLRKQFRQQKHSSHFPILLYPKLHRFFKQHEKWYPNFEKGIFATTVTGEIVGTASSGITIGRFVPASAFRHVDPRILVTIPSVSAIVTAIPLILGMVQTHVENRYLLKKIIDTSLSVIVAVGIAVAISMPVTVPAISSTFYSLAILKDYYLPLYGIFKNRSRKKQELQLIDQKIMGVYSKEACETILDHRDKAGLLKRIEEYYATKPNLNEESIIEARNLLSSEQVSIADIAKNPLIKAAIGVETETETKKFIYQQTHEQKQRLTKEIGLIDAEMPKRIALAANGFITIVGAVLFAIPTPVTMLAGASIMAGSYAITIIIKYDFVPKLFHYFKEKYFTPNADSKQARQNRFRRQPSMHRLHTQLVSEKEDEVVVPEQVKQDQKEVGQTMVNDSVDPPTDEKLSRCFL